MKGLASSIISLSLVLMGGNHFSVKYSTAGNSFFISYIILQYVFTSTSYYTSQLLYKVYNTTGTGPQGAKDNDYPVAINIKETYNR